MCGNIKHQMASLCTYSFGSKSSFDAFVVAIACLIVAYSFSHGGAARLRARPLQGNMKPRRGAAVLQLFTMESSLKLTLESQRQINHAAMSNV